MLTRSNLKIIYNNKLLCKNYVNSNPLAFQDVTAMINDIYWFYQIFITIILFEEI
jgi:hypothetical protein